MRLKNERKTKNRHRPTNEKSAKKRSKFEFMVKKSENAKPIINDALLGGAKMPAHGDSGAQSSSRPKQSGSAPARRKGQQAKQQSGEHRSAESPKQTRKNQPAKGKQQTPAQERKQLSAPKAAKQPKPQQRKPRAPKRNPGAALRVIPLGGLDEIGKNLTVFECGNDIIIIDCGMSFPDEDLPGIDIVIPDFTYLIKNKDRVRGLFVTHGHEDHIGAIPYLLRELNVPVYGTRLTIGLIEGKLKEHNVPRVSLNVRNPGDVIKVPGFTVEFVHVNHSIPDAVAMAIRCAAGLFVHTGDFKIDMTPIDGDPIDLARFAELGKEGVTALFSDSTNAERPGFTPSERIVGNTFSSIFSRSTDKRIIVATFSSNIHRIQQIINEAARYGRKVAVSGRSMINTVGIAAELGYLDIPDGVLIDIDAIRRYTPEQIVIVTTGSQGEPMSALHRMAFSDHRKVSVGPGDVIVISATPIPGNEKFVSRVINELLKLGAEVVFEKMYDVHVSGHACSDELKLIMELTKPRFFMPLHGEYRHLKRNSMNAQSVGIPKDNIMIAQLGNVIEFTHDSMKNVGSVQAGRVLVDGLGVGDVGSVVLRDRKHLAEDGLIAVVMTIDSATGDVVAGPDIVSRGFVYVRESEPLIDDIKTVVSRVLDSYSRRDWATIKTKVRDELSRYLFDCTRRSPMILPIIMEI